MKNFFFILTFILLFVLSGCADKPTDTTTLGSVYGRVHDESNNNELAGVTVSIQNVGNRTTNNDGYYEFKDLDEDIYTISAEKIGYVTESAQVEIEANKNKEVNFTLHAAQPAQLLITPTSLNFGQIETNLNLTINNGGDEELSWQVASDQSWLTTFPSTGTTTTETDEIVATINRGGLEVGNYSGNLSFTSNGGDFIVPVAMEVTPVVLNVSPLSLNFGSEETQLSFTISNLGNGELNWSLTPNQSWINAIPTSGTITTNTVDVTVTIDRAGLTPNTYNGSISINSNGGNQNVNITMIVLEETNIIEHFDNFNNWVNTTYSTTFPDPWVLDSNGYSGSCAKSVCGGYGGGDRLSQTFNFPSSVTVTIWMRKEGYDYITIYLKVDGTTMLNWGGGSTWGSDWTQLQCSIPAGEHEIVIETDFAGTAWIDELEITEN